MAIQKSNRKQHPLIGSWINGDEYATEVEYIVSGEEPHFQVRAMDRYDASPNRRPARQRRVGVHREGGGR